MDNTVELTQDRAYGNIIYRPANKLARQLADLVGTKTLTYDAIEKLRAIGFKVSLVMPEGF